MSLTVINLRGILVKLNYILHDSVFIMHPEIFECVLSISDGVKRTRVGLEFIKKGGIRVLPCQQIPQIWIEDV